VGDAEMKKRQKWPYPLRGFLWGFGIVAVPTLLWPGGMFVAGLLHGNSEAGRLEIYFGSLLLASGMGIAVGTGLIGMLIGYIKVQKKAGSEATGSQCGKCGYSLIGLTGDKCPECGHTVSTTATA